MLLADMKILIIADRAWDDQIDGNSLLTNWFSDFPAEFAQIYCNSGLPNNKICNKYFQLSDLMMARSIIARVPAGASFNIGGTEAKSDEKADSGNPELRAMLKKITTHFVRLCREIVWCVGVYNMPKLKAFINEFSPDLILRVGNATPKLLRVERVVRNIAKCPTAAVAEDDEFSLRQFSLSPFFWINRLWVRSLMKRRMSAYAQYYCHSERQAEEYRQSYEIPSRLLLKSCDVEGVVPHNSVNQPIKMVYIGRMYCNRWKTLLAVAEAVRELNKDSLNMVLEIYTADNISDRRRNAFDDGESVFFKGRISPDMVKQKYATTDLALHIESFDLKNRLLVRESFSTKIIDCLSSGCALVAICDSDQAGYRYLDKHDAAICISSKREISPTLRQLVDNPNVVVEYAEKAIAFCSTYHSQKNTKNSMLADFNRIIGE